MFDLSTLTGHAAPDILDRLRDALGLIRQLPGCHQYDIQPCVKAPRYFRLVERTKGDAFVIISDPMSLSALSRYTLGFAGGLARGFDKGLQHGPDLGKQ